MLTYTKAPPANDGLSLSPDEVNSLLKEESSTAALAGITIKIAGAYSHNQISQADAKAAEQIFRLLLRETEVHVRKTLAEQIKNSLTIPKDIVLTLANDIAEVALPVLQYSEVLSDADLLELIHATRENERYLAIAKRASVSETVSDSLLDNGGEGVAASLVQNNGAKISEKNLAGIIITHADNIPLMQTLRNRQDLPVTIAEKIVTAVSKTIGQSLKQKHHLPEKEFELEIDKTRESETLQLVRQSCSQGVNGQEDIDKLVGQLIAFGRLTPSLILSTLCQGDFMFFETSLARLSNVPLANARTLINDRGDLGFRAIYNKSGLPEPLFQAVRLLLRVIHNLNEKNQKPGSPGYADKVVELLLQHTLPVDNLSYIVALVRKSAI